MSTPNDELLRDDDRRQIAEHGLDVADVLSQLEILRDPPPFTRLLRPCTPGDGIRILSTEERARCAAAHDEARAAGRFLCFVPASGAASRMFRSLSAVLAEPGSSHRAALEKRAAAGDADASEVLVFAGGLPRFAFYGALREAMLRSGDDLDSRLRRGDIGPILEHLLTPHGLDYAALPKGLLEFHRYPDGSRTAFEEHLVEAATYARERSGKARLHFSVSPQHLAGFRSLLERARGVCEARLDARFEVGFSHQEPSTDTVAVDLEGRPFRDDEGRLLFRPGGHGALLGNLERTAAELVYVKNVDNVVPDHLRGPTVEWKSVLGGLLVTLQAKVFAALERLASDTSTAAVEEGMALLDGEFGAASQAAFAAAGAAERREAVREMLHRPLRVCGMVRCTGDPGGGPFWVRAANGAATAQIVETAQIDTADPEQKGILDGSTHFNPVDLACALLDHRGQPFALRRYVDPDAVFIAEKSSGGRKLRALEHPGLWNGSMAGWNTVFVEVPTATFNPVKTVNDLLRPQHQPPA